MSLILSKLNNHISLYAKYSKYSDCIVISKAKIVGILNSYYFDKDNSITLAELNTIAKFYFSGVPEYSYRWFENMPIGYEILLTEMVDGRLKILGRKKVKQSINTGTVKRVSWLYCPELILFLIHVINYWPCNKDYVRLHTNKNFFNGLKHALLNS